MSPRPRFSADRGWLGDAHFPLDAFENGVDPFFKLFGVEATDRVLHHDHVRFQLPRLGLRGNERPEHFRDDHETDQPVLP